MKSVAPEVITDKSSSQQTPNETSQSFLTRRVKAVIANDKMFEGLSREQLQHFSRLVENKPASARRNLKSVLESALVDVHARFIAEYETNVAGMVAAKYSELESLEDRIGSSIEKLSVNRERMGVAIDQGVSASSELGEVERKLELISQFRDLFTISDSALPHQSDDLQSILKLVDLIEKKRRNCQSLLKAIPNARQAIDSLNRSVQLLDSLYEKTFFALMKSANQTSSSLLRQSLIFLQDRPHLFHDALLGLCQGRCDGLSADLLHVLTRDEDGLELNSFDSVKLVSDMLSWFLDAVVGEKDHLDSLVDGVRDSLWSHAPVLPKLDYLDATLSGIEEMIESRLSSSVKSTFAILDLFKLSKIVNFYAGKVETISGAGTQNFFKNMHNQSFAAFEFQWDRRISTERSSVLVQLSPGLNPPPVVTETVFLIDNILAIHSETSDSSEESLFSVLSSGIDPLIQLCVQAKSGASATESAVFLINCLAVLLAPLKKHSFTGATLSNLEALTRDQMEVLVREAKTLVLKNTGLGAKLEAIRNTKNRDLETHPELHPIALSSSVKSFYSLLFTQGIAALSHTDALIFKDLRADARRAVGSAIADVYEELYTAVNHMGVTSHTPAQVRALLDL